MITELNIQAGLRNGITYLKSSFFTPPLKVADITEDKKAPQLKLMIMSSSPGILSGDNYQVKIHLAENCSLQLSTQSYQRLFTMAGCASQTTQVHLAPNAYLHYIPHPTVPHRRSNFTSVNHIYLRENCTLIWGEVLTNGRHLNNESFSFTKYHSVTHIYLNKRLAVKENLYLDPASNSLLQMGVYEGYTHQATLFLIYEQAPVGWLTDRLNELYKEIPGICFGVSLLAVNGLTIKILGYKAEQLYLLLKKAAAFIVEELNIDGQYSSLPKKYAD